MNAPDRHPTQAAQRLYLNLIGGERRGANDGRTIEVLCPSDGRAFAAIARSGAAEIDDAVRAARAAF
jgi:aldehyde dehydrogenase (NAD+)